MPEITAVQFMTENIKSWLNQEEIIKVELLESHNPKRISIQSMPSNTGAMIDVQRKGKTTIVLFPSGTLLLHYQLSGKIIYGLHSPPKSTRVVFTLGNGTRLYWVDRINFGSIYWCSSQKKIQEYQKNIGPEFWPMKRTGEWWKKQCSSTSAIHKTIIDQKRVAGVGNIIAIETLHRSHIHPKTPANRLSAEQWSLISEKVHQVVNMSHQHHNSLRDKQIQQGVFDGSLPLVSEGHIRADGYLVYGREHEQCPQCLDNLIHKEKLSGRPIYLCPTCQKL